MTTPHTLDRGRESFRRRAWADAYTELSAADAESSLEPGDLERLALAAGLIGRLEEGARAWERGHRAWLASGAVAQAVRCAFWLGMNLIQHGDMARGGG